MDGLLTTVVVVVAAFAFAAIGFLVKERRLPRPWPAVLAAACGAALLVQLVTDWPFPTGFWADHGVVTSVLSSVLLLGVAYLVYEDRELRIQDRLDASLTAAGVGGIVDKLVDVDVALGLVCGAEDPRASGWTDYSSTGRPLRWLRQHPERLVARDGRPADDDPRGWAARLPATPDPAWRVDLVDQCIRRLLTAIRDWSPVINTSRNGTQVLIAIAELRKDLMVLAARLTDDAHDPLPLLTSLRQRVRLLSAFLEALSGAVPPRPEILQTFDPMQPAGELAWTADPKARDLFQTGWRRLLADTERQLRSGSVNR
ncbi:hypothetical protein [Nocardioides halotolerans]|uniref:hypothetical protein n=1 Tax=Nocardioides halotolerans TaxID=433660 RepID=UPI000429F155|nr:hypothetical protein [Nocardioides halotolerans]